MEDKSNSSYKSLIWMSSFVLVIWFGYWALPSLINCVSDWGSVGDMFGSLNTLFTGLAFAGLIFTISLQRKDLAVQRKALKDSVKAQNENVKAQRELVDAYNSQTKALKESDELRIIIALLNAEVSRADTYRSLPSGGKDALAEEKREKYMRYLQKLIRERVDKPFLNS